MSLADLITDPTPITVSFEFSPPRTEEAEANLWTAIRRLEPLAPAFVSVTYGAGGSTRERTHATVKRIVEETTLKPAAHLTCVAASRGEIDDIVRAYWDAGIRHIVALRGDMPDMSGAYCPHPDGYRSTPELIAGIKKIAPFEVSVSFYPERHPDSPTKKLTWRLKSVIKRLAQQKAAKKAYEVPFASLIDLEHRYAESPDAERRVYANELLDRLSPVAQSIVKWRWLGYTWREIAKELEMDHTAVRRAFFREAESVLRSVPKSGDSSRCG